jgi:hypothetical protein
MTAGAFLVCGAVALPLLAFMAWILWSHWTVRICHQQAGLQQFYRDKLFRPGFLPVIDQWLAEAGGYPTALQSLVENEAYINGLLSKLQEFENEAQRLSVEAERASRIGDDSILVTVILATALFFAGTASSLSSIPLHVVLLLIATRSLAVGAARLTSLPLGGKRPRLERADRFTLVMKSAG